MDWRSSSPNDLSCADRTFVTFRTKAERAEIVCRNASERTVDLRAAAGSGSASTSAKG